MENVAKNHGDQERMMPKWDEPWYLCDFIWGVCYWKICIGTDPVKLDLLRHLSQRISNHAFDSRPFRPEDIERTIIR